MAIHNTTIQRDQHDAAIAGLLLSTPRTVTTFLSSSPRVLTLELSRPPWQRPIVGNQTPLSAKNIFLLCYALALWLILLAQLACDKYMD